MYFKEKKIVELGKNPEILIERKMSNRKDRKYQKYISDVQTSIKKDTP